MRSLTSFLGLPYREELAERSGRRVDEWHHRTRLDLDWRRVFDHPGALDVIESLGYGFEGLDDEGLKERYAGEPERVDASHWGRRRRRPPSRDGAGLFR